MGRKRAFGDASLVRTPGRVAMMGGKGIHEAPAGGVGKSLFGYSLVSNQAIPSSGSQNLTLARGGSRGQVASLQCILHNTLLAISIIRMKALPTMPLLTEGHITEYTPSP